ncbi:MAG: sigma-70 family RNA polymerase sigma factor [Elusimicrobia bacterium]|nr:sigma-70 family RNA polymerase sigma factor [Elusimicrobiota bacterium]
MAPEELMTRYQDRVYAVCLRLAGNPPDASDLAQDVWLRALAALPGFRGEADPGTWLYRIAVNTWKNRVASAPERWRRACAPLDGAPDRGGDSSPALELERAERARALDRAIASVPPDERRALELRELEEKSYREIASIEGVPVGTVKSRIHRARASLRDYVLCLGFFVLAMLVLGRLFKPHVSNVFNQIMGMVSGAAQGVASPRTK